MQPHIFEMKFDENSSLPFPPEVLLYSRSEGGEEVVEVHDNVHRHVQEPAERCVSATNKSKLKNVNFGQNNNDNNDNT